MAPDTAEAALALDDAQTAKDRALAERSRIYLGLRDERSDSSCEDSARRRRRLKLGAVESTAQADLDTIERLRVARHCPRALVHRDSHAHQARRRAEDQAALAADRDARRQASRRGRPRPASRSVISDLKAIARSGDRSAGYYWYNLVEPGEQPRFRSRVLPLAPRLEARQLGFR